MAIITAVLGAMETLEATATKERLATQEAVIPQGLLEIQGRMALMETLELVAVQVAQVMMAQTARRATRALRVRLALLEPQVRMGRLVLALLLVVIIPSLGERAVLVEQVDQEESAVQVGLAEMLVLLEIQEAQEIQG